MKKQLSLLILKYLRHWAKLRLDKVNPTIIGITGSAGKTSTRKAVALLLSEKGIVKESKKANSESGIPLNILGLSLKTYSIFDWLRVIILAPFSYLFSREQYDYYVVEMGIDSPYEPKNMEYLLTILQPHVGIMLNAELAHTEPFDHLVKDRQSKRREQKIKELIAQEKGKLLTSINKSGVAILNTDQKHLANLKSKITARLITFGKKRGSMVRVKSITQRKTYFETVLEYNNDKSKIQLPLILEKNFAYTFAAACALGISFGIKLHDCTKLLNKSFSLPAGRWSIFEGIKDSHIIDSSYNSSPSTTKEALESLKKIAGRSKKIAVIGDMRELGDEAKQAHKDLATIIASNSNEAFLFGDLTKEHTLPVLKSAGHKARHFNFMNSLVKALKKSITKNSWVLVKGSQNTIFLERAVEAILKNESDKKLLCRRGSYWDKKRDKYE